VPLHLALIASLLENGECRPLAGATFNIWHCDAYGSYSGFSDNIMGSAGIDKRFLRGYQITDANGLAEFTTIYPGWYQGRAVHIHFKIRSDPMSETGYEFTSQFFFDDALSDAIFANTEPYAQKGLSTTRNTTDSIYQGSGGTLTLQPYQDGDGYAAEFQVVLDPTSPAGPVGPGGPPGGPPPPR
jgi:protocatechuate 3,4-dioxygenase beta subunit